MRRADLTMPRVRGRVGQVTVESWGSPEEQKLAGKWSWQIQVYVVLGRKVLREEIWHTIEGAELQKPFFYDTEELAQAGLREHVGEIVKLLQQAAGDPAPDGLALNLKSGIYEKFPGSKA